MSEKSTEILLVIGAMSASLSLGLILLQFAIWLICGLTEDENHRELFPRFFRHRHITYKDEIILEGVQPNAGRVIRHKQLRKIFADRKKEIQLRLSKTSKEIERRN